MPSDSLIKRFSPADLPRDFLRDRLPGVLSLLSQVEGSPRPLVLFDTETTGLLDDPTTTIVEFGGVRIDPDGEVSALSTLVNPEMPIPPVASNIHGIRDSDVADAPVFADIHADVVTFLDGAIVAGFNSEGYDVPLLKKVCRKQGLEEVVTDDHPRLDVRRVWGKISGTRHGKLTELASIYGVESDNAHRAVDDVWMTLDVLEGLIRDHGQVTVGRAIWPEPEMWDKDSRMHLTAAERLNVMKGKPARPAAGPRSLRTGGAAPTSSDKESIQQRLRQAILDHLEARPHLPTAQYADIAAQVPGAKLINVSFTLGDMLHKDEIRPEQIACPIQQDVLVRHYDRAMEINADDSGKLKPLREAYEKTGAKEELSRQGVDSICYVQLRMAVRAVKEGATQEVKSETSDRESDSDPEAGLMGFQARGRSLRDRRGVSVSSMGS